MKKLMIFLMSVVVCGLFTACGDDEWGNNNPAMEHIYYYGLANVNFPGGNELIYNVKQGEIVAIPTHFWSAYKRSYSPVVAYYTTVGGRKITKEEKDKDNPVPVPFGDLVCGTDYQVVDKDGNTLTPDANGGYSMTWPNAVQGTQYIYIKALNGNKGRFTVLTFDPAKEKNLSQNDVNTTTIVKTNEYEVRAFTENYFVSVNIE